jgi:hypothetical protein
LFPLWFFQAVFFAAMGTSSFLAPFALKISLVHGLVTALCVMDTSPTRAMKKPAVFSPPSSIQPSLKVAGPLPERSDESVDFSKMTSLAICLSIRTNSLDAKQLMAVNV